MATLREFILNQSSLPTGNTVRDHILNPSSGTGVVVRDLEGTVLSEVELYGSMDVFELIGIVEEVTGTEGSVEDNEMIAVSIAEVLQGEINE